MKVAPSLITVSGHAASGTTTLSEKISENFRFEILNGGDIFREMAADRGLGLSEFKEVASEDPSIDREVDAKIKTVINNHLSGGRESKENGLIVESRLAGWHANGQADLSIWLSAPLEVRVSRIGDRAESPSELKERDRSAAERYKEFYGIDIDDLSVYDLVIDTSTMSKEGMFSVAESALNDVL